MSKKWKVTRDEVIKIAGLAKLELSDDEIEKYTSQMNKILEYIAQLNELHTEAVEPLSHVLDLTNVGRKDVEEASLARTQALKNAPQSEGEYFIVPKVIDKTS